MTTATTVRSVADALKDAARWRTDEEARHKSQLVEVDQQVRELQQALESLKEKLESLQTFRAGLDATGDEAVRGEIQRAHDGIFAALDEQKAALEERSTALKKAEARRLEMLGSVLAEGELAAKLDEYRQFKESVEPTLANMPESYKSVVMGHHETVASALRGKVAEIMADPVHAEGGKLSLEVAYAIDAPEGSPELLVVVTPVAAVAHEDWADREEDLQTRLSARVVQAIYEACHAVGLETVQVNSGGHRGLLAIEADVMGASSELAAELDKRLAKVFREGLELTAAKIEVSARSVHADHILGLVEEEEVLDVE